VVGLMLGLLLLAGGAVPAAAQTAPSAPSSFEAIGGIGSATLRWAAPVAGADGVEVRMLEVDHYDPSGPTQGTLVCRVPAPQTSCRATGLDGSKTHSFRAFAYRGDDYSQPAIHNVGSSSITSTGSPSTLVYGGVVTIKGRLASSPSATWGTSGHEVTLQYRPLRRDGAWGTWTDLATTVTDDTGEEPGEPNRTGEFTFTHKTLRRSQYRVLYAGDSGFFGAASQRHAVAVAPKVTAALSTASMRLGGTARLSGTVAPKLAGQTVELQRRRADGTWAVIATQKLSDTSGYRFAIKPTKRGTTTYRVRIRAQTLYAKGVSPARTLKVT
jgi:serine protease